jgi:hypothetical protein
MRRRTWDELSDDELREAAAELKRREPLRGFDGICWSDIEDGEYRVKKDELFREIKRIERRKNVRGELAKIDADKRRPANG